MPLLSSHSVWCCLKLLRKTNHQQLIQSDRIVFFIESIGSQILQYLPVSVNPLTERTYQDVVFIAFADGKPCAVSIFTWFDVFTFLIGQDGSDHLGNMAKIRDALRKIDPTGHIMSRCHSLDLLFPTQAVLSILETETEKQIAENSPFDFSVEAFQFVGARKPLRDSFYGCRTSSLSKRSLGYSEGLQKFSSASSLAETKHIEDSRQYRRKFEV